MSSGSNQVHPTVMLIIMILIVGVLWSLLTFSCWHWPVIILVLIGGLSLIKSIGGLK